MLYLKFGMEKIPFRSRKAMQEWLDEVDEHGTLEYTVIEMNKEAPAVRKKDKPKHALTQLKLRRRTLWEQKIERDRDQIVT